MEESILVLGAAEVERALAGREAEVLAAVADAYVAHGRGETSLPHSTFLRFPGDDRNRIIALPAFLGGPEAVAGMKWIASFPGNLERGLERASAVLVLNSCDTGRPTAILEGSIVSARRTAASAALAARELLGGAAPAAIGLIGTGVINFEVARFLRAALPGSDRFTLFDLDTGRAGRFAERLARELGVAEVATAASSEAVLAGCPLVSFATTAIRPHTGLAACPPGAALLHVSLRDLTPEAILAADNLVDDADHVCRAQTSVHLAEQASGGRAFIRCTLADVLDGRAPARRDDRSIAVFSPFGLGILDLAVGRLACDLARETGDGTLLRSFLPGGEA
jgi:N-[(2S)-2-amino-2-carboxyethyl]-L-glutamate dehydrogenase